MTPSGQPDRPHLALVTGHPGPVGGMEKFARFIADAALTADWRVTVALSGHDIFEDARHDFGGALNVQQVDWVDATFKGDRHFHGPTVLSRRAWFRKFAPDVALFIQSSNTPFRAAVAGAAMARVPAVITHRTMPYVIPDVPSRRHLFGLIPGVGLYRRKHVARTRLVAALASRIVFNSEQVRREYENDYHYPRQKGMVIPNAVDAPMLEPPAGRSDRPIVIGYVGRLSREKRLDVLVDAFAALKTRRDARLAFWGDGPEEAALRERVRALGVADRVQWHGTVEDVWPAYEACDIVTLCSPRESSSNMILEAMAAGRAVVVTGVGGLAELVGEGRNGLIVPPGDPPALARALESLIDNDVKRLCLGVRARVAAEAMHDSRTIGFAWLGLLNEVAQSHRPRIPRRRSAPQWSKELVPVDVSRL